MIAAGSSERGLSEVTIDPIGEPRGDLPHQRALAAVAIPTAAEDRRAAVRWSAPVPH